MNILGIGGESGRWISSCGGPLVAMPEFVARKWQGNMGQSEDYNVACAVERLVQKIHIEGRNVLVFGDEPTPFCWTSIGPGKALIWRSLAAPKDWSIPDSIELTTEMLQEDATEEFQSCEENWLLFDAALSGEEALADASERLAIAFGQGTWTVSTYWFRNSELSLYLHLFEQK